MPTVKRYTRQVTEEPLPSVRRQEYRVGQLQTPAPRVTPSPDALGAGFAQTAGNVFTQLYADQQKKQDEIRLLDLDGKLGQLENDITSNPKTGFRNVKGEGAYALPDQVGKTWDDGAAKILQGAANDRQRMALEEHIQGRKLRLMQAVNDHVDGEMQTVEAQAVNTKVATETEAAWAAVDNPDKQKAAERIQQAIGAITTTYNDHNRNADGSLRSPQEVEDRAIAIATSKIHEGVISGYQDKHDDIAAKVYYETAHDQILPEQRGAIEKSLTKSTVLGDSQRITDTILQKADKDASLTQLQDEVPKLTNDPEVRAKVEEQLKAHVTAQREDLRFQEEQAGKVAKSQLDQAKQQMDQLETQTKNAMDRAPRSLTYEQVVPQSVRDKLSEPVEKAQREYWKMLMDKKEPEDGSSTFYDMKLMAAFDPDKFVGQDLNALPDKVSKAEWHRLVDLQSSIVKGNREEAEKTLGGFRTKAQIVDGALAERGLDPKGATPMNAADKAFLLKVVEQHLTEMEKPGKKLSNDDIQKVVDQMLMPVPVTQQGTFRDTTTNVPAFTLLRNKPDSSAAAPNFSRATKGKVPPPQPGETTQINRKTGERQVWRNGQWVPLP